MKLFFNKLFLLVTVMLISITLFVSCSTSDTASDDNGNNEESNIIDNNEGEIDYTNESSNVSDSLKKESLEPSGKINDGVVLIKSSSFNIDKLGTLSYKSIDPLYTGSNWYKIELNDKDDTVNAVKYLSELKSLDYVDYDYVMSGDGEVESIDISGNTESSGQVDYLTNQGIFDAWGYQKANIKTVGGSSDVVIAVIDTGVDYNHVDLRNNIWVNSAEIPNNGIDDDGNGYVDDYYGWDFVGNDKDPMDDNGHGTHVAGIIAAENNLIGTIGVAFNCKVMCIKAGNSSGYFNNSNIAAAIQYAYMNGASVINMSFGGTSISLAVEEALEDAYNQCVLVAAAGNDGLCNNDDHALIHGVGASYPASLPYVIGVMSTNATGTTVSYFSNYDDTPYDNVEYEVYACGQQIPSTWPNNKYAVLSGTSMASPVVAGIAALLRSIYTDREVYSNKFIQSQIVNTGTLHPFNVTLDNYDYYHSVANVYNAITNVPKPSISLADYYMFDNTEVSTDNNNDGYINAGETISLGIELRNRGGKASSITATIDAIKNKDSSIVDPYVEIITNQISLDNIGTYSTNDGCLVKENGTVTGVLNGFKVKIADNCPNNYLVSLNLTVEYYNGLDNNDTNKYSYTSVITLQIINGYLLSGVISEDTTFTADKNYVITTSVVIPEDVTVTFEAGSTLTFYGLSQTYIDQLVSTPKVTVYGTLIFNGTKDNRITLKCNDGYEEYGYVFVTGQNCVITWNYCDLYNMRLLSTDSNYGPETTWNHCYYQSEADYGLTNGKKASLNGGYGAKYIIDSYIISDFQVFGRVENSTIISKYYSHRFFGSYYFNNNLVIIDNVGLSSKSYSTWYWEIGGSSTTSFNNNTFLLTSTSNKMADFESINTNITDVNIFNGNVFPDEYANNRLSILGGVDSQGNYKILNPQDYENHNDSLIAPYVSKIEILNSEDEVVNVVDSQSYKVRVTFSRELGNTREFNLYYGSSTPFTEFKINGSFVSNTCWEGTLKVNSYLDAGKQYFSLNGSTTIDDEDYTFYDVGEYYSFTYSDNSALSMTMQATATDDGINLTWIQDDYDTLMGYNVYRSNSKDGNYTKLNSSIIPFDTKSFVDENAEPGATYWYTFTVVLSDMSESEPAGKISCTTKDTQAPNAYHTPVNQGYLNNNLVISCTASDNVAVSSVILYYRTTGADTWKSIEMSKQNNRYSATVFGSDLSTDGLEYYITVSDGVSTINKGTADDPYQVVIKDASTIAKYGDVDGDGVITTKDAMMIIKALNSEIVLTDDEFKRADLNKDNVLSSAEALRILQYINGKVSSLEMD